MATMTINEVLRATGLTRAAFYKLRREGRFPEPLKSRGRALAFDAESVRRWRETATLNRDWASLMQAGEGSVFAPIDIAPLPGTAIERLLKEASARVPSPPSPKAAKAADALARHLAAGVKKGFGLKSIDGALDDLTKALAARCAEEFAAALGDSGGRVRATA